MSTDKSMAVQLQSCLRFPSPHVAIRHLGGLGWHWNVESGGGFTHRQLHSENKVGPPIQVRVRAPPLPWCGKGCQEQNGGPGSRPVPALPVLGLRRGPLTSLCLRFAHCKLRGMGEPPRRPLRARHPSLWFYQQIFIHCGQGITLQGISHSKPSYVR